ncbi:MAG: hypothetical protein J6C53_00070 [Clostridia bacterium]|nr:hypothetical protein [Clostridia bacterium]
MLYACIAVVAVFIAFITITYFVTRKSCQFEFEGKKIKVINAGSSLRIFVNDALAQSYHMPQLIHGETFELAIDDKPLTLKCKTNAYGNKLSVKAYASDQEIFNNGVIIKEK